VFSYDWILWFRVEVRVGVKFKANAGDWLGRFILNLIVDNV